MTAARRQIWRNKPLTWEKSLLENRGPPPIAAIQSKKEGISQTEKQLIEKKAERIKSGEISLTERKRPHSNVPYDVWQEEPEDAEDDWTEPTQPKKIKVSNTKENTFPLFPNVSFFFSLFFFCSFFNQLELIKTQLSIFYSDLQSTFLQFFQQW
jgi:hypothetical protein